MVIFFQRKGMHCLYVGSIFGQISKKYDLKNALFKILQLHKVIISSSQTTCRHTMMNIVDIGGPIKFNKWPRKAGGKMDNVPVGPKHGWTL